MAVPDFQTLLLPVLRAVAEKEAGRPELRERVADALGLSEKDRAELLPTGRQTVLESRVDWALVYMRRAGLVERVQRGVYRIGEPGRQLLATSPEQITRRMIYSYPQYVTWQQENQGDKAKNADVNDATNGSDLQTPQDRIESAMNEIASALEADILERMRAMSPLGFQRLLIDLLLKMGYGGGQREMAGAVRRGADGGIDGTIKEDELGLDVVYLQAKRYGANNTVGRPDVQAFVGSLEGEGASKGLFFTTSSFSAGALDYVKRISKRIILVDGHELARLLIRHDVGVQVGQTYAIKTVDENAFLE